MTHQLTIEEAADLLTLSETLIRLSFLKAFEDQLYFNGFYRHHAMPGIFHAHMGFDFFDGSVETRLAIDFRDIRINHPNLHRLIQTRGETAGHDLLDLMLHECRFARDVRPRWFYRWGTRLDHFWAGWRNAWAVAA